MRIWWLFIECLLYDRSFVFVFPRYFSFHFFISYAFHQVGMWGVKSPDWCYKATEYQMWIESRSPWLWSFRENSCGIQLNGCLSWYQVTCVATFQTELIPWSRFALKTGSLTIHLTYGKKSTNIPLEKSSMLPECQLHANIHQMCLEILSQYLPHQWSSICLSSCPIKSDAMGWNYGKK